MKLIFLYGPPAVGKFTIAKELSKLSKYKLLHNHSIFDLVYSSLIWKKKESKVFYRKVALDIIEEALKQNIKGLIFTHVHDGNKSNDFIENIINLVNKYRGEIYFVQIMSDKATLRNRVRSKERKDFKKITNPLVLEYFIRKHDVFSKISNVNTYVIDNTNLNPKETAKRIKDFL